jgi:hypothetical protein
MQSSMGVPARTISRGSDDLRSRAATGEAEISAPSGALIRKTSSQKSQAFRSDYAVEHCDSSTDEGFYFVVNIAEFVRKCVWIRRQQLSSISMLKFNCDSGQESLKLLLQILFEGDPQLQSRFTQFELRQFHKKKFEEHLDSGVKRTFIIGLIPGADESTENVRLIFNKMNFRELFDQCDQYSGEIVAPNDGKMQNKMLGIGPHSSRFPCPYRLWSQNRTHSRPEIVRTAATVSADNIRRMKAKGKPIDFNSVEAEPVKFLLEHPNKNLQDVLTIPPLHNCVLVVNKFVGYLVKLLPDTATTWILGLNCKPNPRRGKDGLTGFAGNDSRKILKSTAALRKLLPSLETVNVNVAKTSGKEEIDYKSAQYLFKTVWQLVLCIEDLNQIVHRTTSPKLHDDWAESTQDFQRHWLAFSEAYQNINPSSMRNYGLTSPKIHNLLVELPEYISRSQHSLFRVHEQAFETVHSDYKKFEKRYSVPNCGFIRLESKSSTSSSTNERTVQTNDKKKSDEPPSSGTRSGAQKKVKIVKSKRKREIDHSYQPSSGTRSGAQKKRKLKEKEDECAIQERDELVKFLLSLAPQPTQKPAISGEPLPGQRYGDRQKAQSQRLRAISAYTASHFPARSQERLLVASMDAIEGHASAPWNKNLE